MVCLLGLNAESAESAPNILFCISDDQSYAHTGANGDPVVKTPAFDRVAREGLRFIHAFCDAPTCGPSRSAILTGQAVAAVRAKTGLPLLAKLAPNVPDITEIARAAVDAGADALTICNTMPAMRIDIQSRQPVLGNITGGLSGPGLRPISLALVYQASNAVSVPIIGVGGILTGEHAAEYILAGASAVQIGSANLVGLSAPWRILGELQDWMRQSGGSSLKDLIGGTRPAADV